MNEDLLRLAWLYEKYTNGNCTPEERTEFLTIVNGDESVETLNGLIDKDIASYGEEKQLEMRKADQLFDAVLSNAKKQEAQSRPLRTVFTMRGIAAAASVIFLLGLSTYLLWKNNAAETIPTAHTQGLPGRFKNDIAPGGNKAMLTLADGTTIALDTATNGILSAQGGTNVIKLQNGELSYASTNAADAEVLYNTISTPRGGQYQLVLADGSKVWLNAGSSLRFPARFAGSERKVQLTGEAYFEVAKNAAMPFKVAVAEMEVEVLGTHFNVNAYNDENAIKTTLIEGAVSIKSGQNQQLMAAGQQVQVDKSGQLKLLKEVDMEEAIAWKNGQFIFSGNDIHSVMRQLEKWYDIDVEYDSNLTSEEFVGMISRSSNISQILHMLEKTKTVKFEINGKKVTVK